MFTIIETDEQFLERAIRFCLNIDDYIDVLGINPVKVQAFKSNKILFDFAFKNKDHLDEFGKNSLHEGVLTIEQSFWDLIWQCKNSPAYTNEIGERLGIEDSGAYLRNPFLPDVRVDFNEKGQPVLKWNLESFEGLEIWKYREAKKDFEPLATVSGEEYTDTENLPTTDKPTVWKYRLGYVYKGEVIDNWRRDLQVMINNSKGNRAAR